jgi:hypothetical protein
MVAKNMAGSITDDPRKLSAMITRVSDLAVEHSVPSVVVGMTAAEGDRIFPDYVHYLQSALRVEDGIFHMTRERVVVHIADSDTNVAKEILERLMAAFCDEFPSMDRPNIKQRMFEVTPGAGEIRVKDVLTQIFSPRVLH